MTAKEPTEFIDNIYKNNVKDLGNVLSNIPLPDSVKEILGDKKRKYEKKLLRATKEIDPTKEYQLLMLGLPPSILSGYDHQEWKAIYSYYIASLRTKKPEGRPKLNIFLNALIKVIYSYLIKPKRKELAKNLTSDILNECFNSKGLRKLTYKVIDHVIQEN